MVDFSKPLQTRDGREVRIYAQDGLPPWTIHGAIKRPDGWEFRVWPGNGQLDGYFEWDYDLINTPITVYVNVYENGSPGTHKTKEEAEQNFFKKHTGRAICALPVTLS